MLHGCCKQFCHQNRITTPNQTPTVSEPHSPSMMTISNENLSSQPTLGEMEETNETKSRMLRKTFRNFWTGQIIGSGGFGIVNELVVWDHIAQIDAEGDWVVLGGQLQVHTETDCTDTNGHPGPTGDSALPLPGVAVVTPAGAVPPGRGARILGHFALKTMCKHDIIQRPTGLANLYLELNILIRLKAHDPRPPAEQCSTSAARPTAAEAMTRTQIQTDGEDDETSLTVPSCGANFICHMHCAFQDARFVYMVLDLAERGGKRDRAYEQSDIRGRGLYRMCTICRHATVLELCDS